MRKIKTILIIALIIFLPIAAVAKEDKIIVPQNEFSKIFITKQNKLKHPTLVRAILGTFTFIIVFLVIFVRIRIGREIKKRKLNGILNEKKK